MNFNLKKAKIHQALLLQRYLLFRWNRKLKRLFLVLFVFFLAVFLYGLTGKSFSPEKAGSFLGLAIISLTLGTSFALSEAFFSQKIKKPLLSTHLSEALLKPEEHNLAEFLELESARAVSKSVRFARTKKLADVNSAILFYYLLADNPRLDFVFSRALINFNQTKELLKFQLGLMTESKSATREVYSSDFQETVSEALKNAKDGARERVSPGDILVGLAKHNQIFRDLLIQNKLEPKDIERLVAWQIRLERTVSERKKFWEWENLVKKGSLARTWTAGYSLTLDKFSRDLTAYVRKMGFPEIVGRKKELAELERLLSQPEGKNNALLVGEPGSGRKSIVLALAESCALGQSLPDLNYKRVLQLDLPQLLAQTQSTEEVEALLSIVFNEAITSGNAVLVIDEFHNFVGQTQRPGVIDIAAQLAPYLQSPQFRIVAVTTFEGFHKNIEPNPFLLSLFGKVEVSEFSEQETLELLEKLTFSLEAKHKRVFVSWPALGDCVALCAKYLPSIPFPEKAIEVLEESVVYVYQQKAGAVLPEHVAKIVRDKTKIPVGEIETKEKDILLNLEKLLHQRIIDQEEAIKEVSTALRRARADVTVRKRPMGAFLFLGPTGVGKTETSKALAEVYFGSEQKMIRLDMSEFQQVSDIPRFLGSPGQEGLLTTPVRDNPFSLILLDELEKAHANLLNLFLQVFDEGHLTDGLGRKVDFKNTILIATSNAGYQVILEVLKKGTDWGQVKGKLLDLLFAEGVFRPEFLNRFDAVVVFKPLSKEDLLGIAELLLRKLADKLKEKGIDLAVTSDLKQKIVELGYSPVFGARQMRRVIQDKVENVLAQAILSGRLTRGARAQIDPETFELTVNP